MSRTFTSKSVQRPSGPRTGGSGRREPSAHRSRSAGRQTVFHVNGELVGIEVREERLLLGEGYTCLGIVPGLGRGGILVLVVKVALGPVGAEASLGRVF